MATDTITIKDGKFQSSSDAKGVTEMEINRWNLKIESGRILVDTEAAYGFHKAFRLENGTLRMYRGTDKRYAYFRSEKFQTFLDRFGITAVKREDPNQTFPGFSNHSGWGDASISVVTDGTIVSSFVEDEAFAEMKYKPGNNPNLWSGQKSITVEGATFAIVATRVDYRDSHSHAVTLYAMANPMSLSSALEKALGGKPFSF